MEYEEALENAKRLIAEHKEEHLARGEREEDFYGFYRIFEMGEEEYSYSIIFGSLSEYREMSVEELQEELEALWAELEDLTDEIEDLEEDPATAEELEELLEEKEDVKLSISLVEQVLDEKMA